MRARKIQTLQNGLHIDHPSYKVQFWTGEAECDEWEVDDIDVEELLDWANERRTGRAMTIWAVARGDACVAEVRLVGEDVTPAG